MAARKQNPRRVIHCRRWPLRRRWRSVHDSDLKWGRVKNGAPFHEEHPCHAGITSPAPLGRVIQISLQQLQFSLYHAEAHPMKSVKQAPLFACKLMLARMNDLGSHAIDVVEILQ